ncbi:MAG: 50S ribosomal protein L9 [Ruminococcaceae bacterium]|nr:50S ribosomal protein L9 [Oscillospiraceae bacterium]
MKVILTQDVRGQGKKGDLIEVSDGYARNFLFARKLAVEADKATMNELKNREEAEKFKKETEKAQAKDTAAKLESILVKVAVGGSADGRLYSSVTSMEIAQQLSEQFGIEIDKRKIVLDSPIKAYGKYVLDVKLFAGITGKLNVLVSEKK